MKKAFVIFILFLSSFVTYAQDIQKVAMLPPITKGGMVTDMQKSIVRSTLTKSIANTEGYEAFSRNDIDAIVKEQKFQQSGMVSDEQRTRMGEMSGATLLCISSLTAENKELFVEISLVDVKTGKIIKTTDMLMPSRPNAAIQKSCEQLTKQMLQSKQLIAMQEEAKREAAIARQKEIEKQNAEREAAIARQKEIDKVNAEKAAAIAKQNAEREAAIARQKEIDKVNAEKAAAIAKQNAEREAAIARQKEIDKVNAEKAAAIARQKAIEKVNAEKAAVIAKQNTEREAAIAKQNAERKEAIEKQNAERETATAKQNAERKEAIEKQNAQRKEELAKQDAERKKEERNKRGSFGKAMKLVFIPCWYMFDKKQTAWGVVSAAVTAVTVTNLVVKYNNGSSLNNTYNNTKLEADYNNAKAGYNSYISARNIALGTHALNIILAAVLRDKSKNSVATIYLNKEKTITLSTTPLLPTAEYYSGVGLSINIH